MVGPFFFFLTFSEVAGQPGDFMAPHVVDTKTAMKYVATLALHRRGWLDGNNCVPKRIIAASRAWQKSIGGADDFECCLEKKQGFWY